MILTIIQARMSSQRLPGKILLPIAGKPILQHVIDAAPEPKIVAMPLCDRDVFIMYGESLFNCHDYISWYDGKVDDVLGRFYHTWQDFKPEADWILRLTADCPMLTKEIVDRFIKDSLYKHCWNCIITNRPYDPDGYDMELFSVEALKMAHEHATDPYDREHCTPYLYRHLNVRRFSVFGRPIGPENPQDKVSVDTQEDFEKVKKLMEGK